MKTVYIILAFCAGLFLGHLFFPTEKNIKPPVLTELKQDKQAVASIDSNYQSQRMVYQHRNDSLVKQLKGYKFLLKNTREELSSKREQTFALVDRIKLDTVFQCDTTLMDSLHDELVSLNFKTDSLMDQFQRKDSLMECMVGIRDSQLLLCNKSYDELKILSQEQQQRERKLTEDLNTALKQQNRIRLQNKILAAGMLFTSGIITTIYIKSRQ